MDSKDHEWARAPPPSGTFCERVGKVLYNSEDKSFLGRTAKRWGIVVIFYLIFYAVLALLFAACMGGLKYTIDDVKPKYTTESSLIGGNPGVAHRPLPEYDFVISYNVTHHPDNISYIKQLEEFFEPYKNDPWYNAKSGCNYVDNYGYPDTPCVFIKVNRIYDWKPDYYDSEYLPEEMPSYLIEHITSLPLEQMKQIWITCAEEHSNLTTIEYPWGNGLPERFYPYRNDIGYKSPIVAVRITPTVNKLLRIRCRAWAKNIIYNRSEKEPSGYTMVQLYVAKNNATDS